jgi:hypothetical protein
VHVGKFFARNLGGLTHARKFAGPAREGKSRTPSMHVDEKSDEAVLPRKRPNNERQLWRSWREGPHPGKQPTGGRGSDTEPSYHVDPIGGCAPDRRRFKPRAADVRPEGGEARCVSSAHRDLCGGRSVMSLPRPRPCIAAIDADVDLQG